MSSQLPRARFELDHHELQTLTELCIEKPWLRLSYEAFTDLWQLCDTPEKKALVEELIRRFTVLEMTDLHRLCSAITDCITDTWKLDAKNTLIVAISDNSEADGSQMALQHIKNHFPPSKGWSERNFRNGMAGYDDYLKDEKSYVLFDDFIGTGSTIVRRHQHFRKALSDRGYVNSKCFVIAIAGMEHSRSLLDADGADYFAPLWLKKGIDGHNSTEVAAQKKKIMRSIEANLMRRFNGQYLPSLGYKGSQSLFSIGTVNCPNNVFPAFWWPKYSDKRDRNTIFRRIR